ncbi:unnamed protein product [Trifolium pratense]|uniref:Uncharacterized protein n=1 Tax=Trifolium pratense TaxID=57577 RepID=A0ACB0KGK1_TRIPR|nr:unnamed protein product [Trifolium pratense]
MAPAVTSDNNTNSSNKDFDDTQSDNNDIFADQKAEKDTMSATHGGNFEYLKCHTDFETKEQRKDEYSSKK